MFKVTIFVKMPLIYKMKLKQEFHGFILNAFS